MTKLIIVKEYDSGFEKLIESFLLSNEQYANIRKVIVKQYKRNKLNIKGCEKE